MPITLTLNEGINCKLSVAPITVTLSAIQVNSGYVLPAVTGNALKFPRVNSSGTAYELVNIPAGTGDVISPATNTDNYIPQWDGNDSKTLKDGISTTTFALAGHDHDSDYEPIKGTDDNYVTDAEKTKLSNLSGTNTGDQDLSGYALKSNVLELNNTTAFTPDADYEPATKKYVDDAITGSGGYTDEQAQDAIGSMVNSTLTYTDGTPELKVTNPITPQTTGFTITAGATPKTLTVANDANVSGTNTGDQTIPDQLSDLSDDSTHRLVTDTEKSTWNSKAAGDHNHTGVYAPVLGEDDNYVTDAEKTKLANLSGTNTGDQTIPDQLSDLSDDTTHRLVTDTEKSTWNGKQDALGFTAENSANKENTTIDTSTTKYPTVNLLKTGLDTKINSSLFDANTILKADADNTPEALTVNEERVVGRITGGEITDLTAAQLRTLLQYINLTASVLSTNSTYIPLVTMSVTVDTNTIGFGGALTDTSGDAHYDDANATDATKLCGGIAVESGTGTKTIMIEGQICNTSWNWSTFGRINGKVYLNTSNGELTQTAPSSSGNVVQCIGFALSADTIYVNIDGHYLTRT